MYLYYVTLHIGCIRLTEYIPQIYTLDSLESQTSSNILSGNSNAVRCSPRDIGAVMRPPSDPCINKSFDLLQTQQSLPSHTLIPPTLCVYT